MTTIRYALEPAPVAGEFAACQQRFWDRLACPGTWLMAEQRAAVAAEARIADTCEACRRGREVLSPEMETGPHDQAGSGLPAPWHEVIHRVI